MFLCYNADKMYMEGLTIIEMAQALGLEPNTVKQRLFQKGIKPFCKDALYKQEDLEAIKNVKPKGWPRKKPEEE